MILTTKCREPSNPRAAHVSNYSNYKLYNYIYYLNQYLKEGGGGGSGLSLWKK